MSLAIRLGGAGIAIFGILIMTSTLWVTDNGMQGLGNTTAIKLPAQEDLNAKTPYLVIGAVVMFIGFGVIWYGRKLESPS